MSKGHSKKQPTRGFSLQQALWQKLKLGLAAGNLLLVLKLLKDARLPLDSPDPVNGWPCLFYAIRYHQPGVLSHFLSHHLRLDVKITTDFQRNSALVIAADVQNDAAFKEILQQSPCPIELMALKNLCGKNALHIAIERGNTGMVKMLLEKGMEIQEPLGDGSTPLHIASAYGFFDIVTLLMLHQASVTTMNKKGFTPLDYAYSEEMRNHLLQAADCVRSNKPIMTPKRKEPVVRGNQTATAYVSYLRSLF